MTAPRVLCHPHEPQARPRPNGQGGQAMTEFVVSVAFVFLAIFVFVPTFGKIMDLQFQNLQAARYVAWERTVWFDQIDDLNREDFVISGAEFESVAKRDDVAIMNSAENRFFRDHGGMMPAPLSENDLHEPDGSGSPVWTYVQSKNSMYGGSDLVDGSFDASETPGFAYDLFDALGTALRTIKEPIDFLLGAVGVDNDNLFELPLMDGEKTFYNPILRTHLNIPGAHGEGDSIWDRDEASGEFTPGIESAFFQNWDGVLRTPAAILADGWNTQSLAHYQDRADDYVPSTIFDNALFDVMVTAASVLEGGPDNSAIGKIGFGEVGINPMPSEDGQPKEAVCDGGFCSFGEKPFYD